MLRTYEGILKGDRVEWTGDGPSSDRSVRIRVTLLDEEDGPERGERMAAALGRLA